MISRLLSWDCVILYAFDCILYDRVFEIHLPYHAVSLGIAAPKANIPRVISLVRYTMGTLQTQNGWKGSGKSGYLLRT